MTDRPGIVRFGATESGRGSGTSDHTPDPDEPVICYPIEAEVLQIGSEVGRVDAVDVDDRDSPLAGDEIPTGDAHSTAPISTNDVDESRVPRRWIEAGVEVPDDVTPERLERAVDRSDTLLEVCADLGCTPAEKGAIRTLATIDGLYELLDSPEAGPSRRRA